VARPMADDSIRVFEIAKGNGGVSILVLLVPVVILLGVLWLSWPRSLKVEVGPSALRLRGSVYGRVIPRSELMVEHLRVVDVRGDSPFALASRTNGIGLPHYSVGWFRLENGQKALAFVTQRDHVVYLPTRQGYALLLSVEDHHGFAASLAGAAN
jgi:Bacterial PH domain